MKTHLIICPYCHATVEVEAASGKLVNKWQKKNPEQSRGERFNDALREINEGKKKRDEYFSSAADKLQEKKKKANQLFGEQLKKVKEEGLIEPPPRPFDLD